MLKVLLEIELVYPFSKSLADLHDFCMLWNGNVVSGGTNSHKASILIPTKTFKQLFGSNPKIGQIQPPSNSDYFIKNIVVKKIEDF